MVYTYNVCPSVTFTGGVELEMEVKEDVYKDIW